MFATVIPSATQEQREIESIRVRRDEKIRAAWESCKMLTFSASLCTIGAAAAFVLTPGMIPSSSLLSFVQASWAVAGIGSALAGYSIRHARRKANKESKAVLSKTAGKSRVFAAP